jgi:hypothetical protein
LIQASLRLTDPEELINFSRNPSIKLLFGKAESLQGDFVRVWSWGFLGCRLEPLERCLPGFVRKGESNASGVLTMKRRALSIRWGRLLDVV